LRVTDRALAADAADLTQAEKGISITPDGKVEEIPLPEGIEAAFRDMLAKYEPPLPKKGGSEEPLIRPESVIGEDTRVQVTNTTAYPYRTVGRIDIGCTGTLIGVRHVLTAGHCVYNINTDKWYSNLNVTPGQNGGTKPYGTVTWKKAISVQGWTKNHDRNYDYAMIVLNQELAPPSGRCRSATTTLFPCTT
jgi:V8-like Glu-specific endopeptidase